MIELDHIVIVAPSLEAGAAHVKAQLGVAMPFGGEHPQMGTHNLLARIGPGVFLEVIAINHAAPQPKQARWFGLDNAAARAADWAAGRRLRGWIGRTGDLDRYIDLEGETLGHKIHVTRGDRAWDFVVRPDGELPDDGALPPLIDWGVPGTPADNMPDIGLSLTGFVLEHPEPKRVAQIFERLEISNPPGLQLGAVARYRALFETPNGSRELT